MRNYSTIARGRKRSRFAESQLDLFADGGAAMPALPSLPPSLAETRIARRFGVSLAMARVYAELASLGGRA